MSEEKKKSKFQVTFGEQNAEAIEMLKGAEMISAAREYSPNQIVDVINESKRKRKEEEKVRRAAPALGITEDPHRHDVYNGSWRKRKLLPDAVIKDVCLADSLISAIIRARANTMSMFGHIRRDRFDIGMEINIKEEIESEIEPEQLEVVQSRIDRFKNLLMNCGHVEGIPDSKRLGFSEFMYKQTYDAMRFGRIATENVFAQADGVVENPSENGRFHRFRPIDVSTIYRLYNPKDPSHSAVRKASEKVLSREGRNESIDVPPSMDGYAWRQEVDGIPQQSYSDKELSVFSFFPSNDIEYNGYPITPLDTCVNSVTTHISIEAYNKLFFQNGRGAKGILALSSDEADQDTIDDLKQQYMAGVNDVSNSFRTPMIAIGAEDKLLWIPTESNSKDGEFAFLYDAIARNILSAFNMSPDELPGYGHLSKGTNQQTLSEGNNEFKLTAARDTGLRPLILKWEEYLNSRLFPIMDPELAQICTIQLAGLDAQSRDQEAVRLQQESGIHMSYDEVRKGVDKPIVGDRMGGEFPFSERYQLIADKYLTAGELIQKFLQDPTARLDKTLAYRRDPFALQFMQLLMQVNPVALQASLVTRDDQMEVMRFLLQDYLEEIGE